MKHTLLHHALSIMIAVLCLQPAHGAMKVTVSVEGVEGDIKKNVLAFLSIEKHKEYPDLTERLLKKLHRRAPDEIRKALQPFGYYSPEIQSELLQKESVWHAHYIINSGDPVIIKELNVLITGEGADDERFTSLREDVPLKTGDVLVHDLYEQIKGRLRQESMRSGYLKAEIVKSMVKVFPAEKAATVTIHFHTGPQYRFGEVEFVQDAFTDEFVRRFVTFKKGEPYSMSRLLNFQNALNDSDYFDSVEVIPDIERAKEREVPVTVKLAPRKRNRYAAGLGYGTDTGFRGSIGWTNRRLNTRGHRFSTELKMSEIRSSLTAEYLVPLKKVRTDSIGYTAGWITEETETSESEKYFGSIRYNHMRREWTESIYLRYEEETYDIASDEGTSSLLLPGISWTLMRADNKTYPRKGGRLFLEFRGAHESLISDVSFAQMRTQVTKIYPVFSRGRLIMRGEAGMTGMEEFSELPASVRFFAGGDRSVRGYAYNSLGPEDNEGNVVGGRNMLAGSIEYEHRIKDKWSAAVFYDVGNAIDSLSDPLKSGAGFGIRWLSPVGPIRLDLATALSESGNPWRIHFVVGPDL